jgi:Tfp pilus assembly protein PilF
MRIAPLQNNDNNIQPFTLKEGSLKTEVVIANRGAAHSLPPEVRDLYEMWVEFEAVDANGQKLFHSGFLHPDGTLDESAHVYKSILLDQQARPITRHQIWLTGNKAYDNTIQAGRADVVRFEFDLPKNINTPITLKAAVNYRRFNQEYTDYVLKQQRRVLSLPIVKMAETMVKISPSTREVKSVANSIEARRWNDYGIALLEQTQYGAAATAFQQAIELTPEDLNLWINAAIAEMRSERFGPELSQWQKAAALLSKALSLEPTNHRAQFYQALVWRGMGKYIEAAEQLQILARLYPRDREVQKQLAQTTYVLGDLRLTRTALELVLAIDPNDANSYQLLASIYANENAVEKAAKTEQLYLQWREDPMAEALSTRFFAAHPEWQDERINTHTHRPKAAARGIVRGKAAAPQH